MAWHIDCYNASRPDSKAVGRPAKFRGECATCAKPIKPGDLITWSRRFGKGRTEAAATAPNPPDPEAVEDEPTDSLARAWDQ